jgi:predicted O-methyltransferase YrrM
MKRSVMVAGICGLALSIAFVALGQRRMGRGSSASSLPAANSEAEKKVLSVLDELQRTGGTYLSVDVNDGRMLRLLTEAADAKNVVEIGTSTGFSGLWLCLALQKTGGKLTTFEYDSGRAATARANFKKAGVDQVATVVEGDAHQTIAQLKSPIDVVFIDADKEGYTDYLNKLLPLVRSGGLILAHNVGSSGAYVQAVTSNPALETIFYSDGGGLGITLKKR